MIACNVSESDLQKALDKVNGDFRDAIYQGNIAFKNIAPISSKRIRFTLKVLSSKGPGASRNPISSRRSAAACWHAHGDFFAALLSINPAAIITSLHGKHIIDINGGNWQDYNCGSLYQPYNASDACECNGEW